MSGSRSSPSQDNRPISITTPLGANVLLLVSFKLTEELGVPFSMEMKLQSLDANIAFNSIIGQNVTVTVLNSNKTPRYFNGFISHFALTGFEEGEAGIFSNYRAVMVPWLWMLGKGAQCRIFQDQGIPDIVESVCKSYGFSAIVSDLTTQYPQIPFCVQYDETDLAFVNRLIEQAGIYYYFDHSASENTLILANSATEPQDYPGYSSIYYNPQTHGPHMAEHVYEWIVGQEVQTGEVTLDDYNYTQPRLKLQESARVYHPYSNGNYQRYSYPGYYQEEADGENLAKIRLQELGVVANTRHGVSNVLGLAAGYQFQLEAYPRVDQNIKHLTTGLKLEVMTASFASGDNASPVFNVICEFSAIDISLPYSPPRRTPRPRMGGPQTATVLGSSDKAPESDSYGNVRVQFHWGLNDKNNESCMVRVSQNSSGNGWGSMFIPHPGTEVIVDFENGDPDRPIITGRVYNADQMPAKDPKTYPLSSYFEDSSEKNLIEMEAKAQAEKLLIRNGRNSILMNSTVGADGIIITDGKSTITFDTPADTVRTSVDRHQKVWVKGDSKTDILGLQSTNVMGYSWNGFFAAYSILVAGVYTETFLGAKFSVTGGMRGEIFKGWDVNKWLEGRAHKSPESIEMVDLGNREFGSLTTKCTEEVREITEAYALSVGEMEQKVTGGLTVQAATFDQTTTGATSLQSSNFSTVAETSVQMVAGAEMLLSGSSVTIDGPLIELG